MSDIYLQQSAAGREARRTNQETTERQVPAAAPERSEAGQTASRADLLDLAALPAERSVALSERAAQDAAAQVHEGLSAYYRDDLDAESVKRLAHLVREQLSIQTLSIVNAHALGLLSMIREVELM